MAQFNTASMTDYGAEQKAIDRRRKLAEMLQGDSLQPMQLPTQPGVRASPLGGLAKVLGGYLSGSQLNKAETDEKALAERRRQALAGALGGMPVARQESSPFDMASVGQDMPDDAQIGGLQTQKTVQPGMQDYAGWMGQLAGIGPDAVQIGGTMLNMQQGQDKIQGDREFRREESQAARDARAHEQQLNRQARLDAIELAAREGRITREDADRRSADLRREMQQAQIQGRQDTVRLAASMRPPRQEVAPTILDTDAGQMTLPRGSTQAVPITGPNGKPVMRRAGGAGSKPMSATAQRELLQADERVQGATAAVEGLKSALDINDKAMGFAGAGAVSTIGTLLPQGMRPATVDATQNLDNIITTTALPQLKMMFGGMPTEGERKVLLEVQGSSSKSPAVRKSIYDRAIKAVEARAKFDIDKAKRLREGTYFSDEGGATDRRASSGDRRGSGGATGEWSVVK